MTILEALQSINTYPVDELYLQKVCLDRMLTYTETYTKTIGDSEAFRLATADTWFWLGHHPSIVEQEVGINNAIAIKEKMLENADKIYGEYDDPKYSGRTYGYVGESFNG